MMKKLKFKLFGSVSVVVFIIAAVFISPASALLSQGVASWSAANDANASAVIIGDVNGDSLNEIITAGWFNDGMQWNAQLIVRNAATQAVISEFSWHSVMDTQITCLALGDLNADGINEIVTGGSFFDGNRWLSHIVVFEVVSGSLTVLSQYAWYWISNTRIASIVVGDANNDGTKEIITVGTFSDNTRQWSQLIVWTYSGGVFTPLSQFAWYYLYDTLLTSVALGDVNNDGTIEIVTGGTRYDGTRWVAHMVVFNLSGSVLSVTNQLVWYWISDTEISSIAIADVNSDTFNEIVTGGSRFDLTRWSAQLLVFNGATMSVLNQYVWYFYSNTKISSVALGSFAATTGLDIVTVGTFNDGQRDNAMLLDWFNIATGQNQNANWFTTSNTEANSAAIGNLGTGNRIVVAGSYYDLTRSNAQLSVWG